MANALVVTAHPLAESLTATFAEAAETALRRAGHDVTLLDLAARGFDPRLTAEERQSYYAQSYDAARVAEETDLLRQTDILVLVFPTWWFSPPALMKGFFDRVFAPGVAYDHAADLSALEPRLTRLRRVTVITTLGSPWWIDRLVMRRPVRRVIATGLIGACAPQAKTRYLALYKAEKPAAVDIARFKTRIVQALSGD